MAGPTLRSLLVAGCISLQAVFTNAVSQPQPFQSSPLAFLSENSALQKRAANESLLIASVIYTNADNNSALQCWEFTDPLKVSNGAGTAGAETFTFLDLANMTYTHLPPRFDGGIHNAPAPQYVLSIDQKESLLMPRQTRADSLRNRSGYFTTWNRPAHINRRRAEWIISCCGYKGHRAQYELSRRPVVKLDANSIQGRFRRSTAIQSVE